MNATTSLAITVAVFTLVVAGASVGLWAWRRRAARRDEQRTYTRASRICLWTVQGIVSLAVVAGILTITGAVAPGGALADLHEVSGEQVGLAALRYATMELFAYPYILAGLLTLTLDGTVTFVKHRWARIITMGIIMIFTGIFLAYGAVFHWALIAP